MKPGRLRAVRWTELAIVFQGALHTLNPVQRVGDQIGEAIRLHSKKGDAGDVSKRVGELLELVGLPARRASAYPHQLSGGQRQRVLIGLAVACEPRLLIADEPTTALDVMVQAQVLRLLADLQRELGLAIIFITHDLSTLADICRRIAVMYAGRIIEEGPNDKVFAEAVHPYTRALAAAFPVIGDPAFRMRPSGLPGDPPDPRHLPSGCPFHPRCPVAIDACPHTPVELWPAGANREAACVHVRALRWPRERRRAAARGERPPRALPRARGPGARGGRCGPHHPRGRDGGARGGVRLRQDDARPHDHGPQPAERRRGALPRRATRLRQQGRAARAPPPRADDLPGPHRRAERSPDALRGGGRGHPDPGPRGQRGRARGERAFAGRPAPAGELLHALSVRDLGRPAPARDHRGRDGPEPEPARGGRAGVGARRVGARRDPRADARASSGMPG